MKAREIIVEQLREVRPALTSLKDDFFLIGASAMILSGVDITTSDIDLFTSRNDADLLKTLWANHVIDQYKPPDSHLFRSNFTRFRFKEISIEVMGGLEVNKSGTWTALTVESYYNFDSDLSIKVPTIAEQKRILNFFGRPKDLERIALLDSLSS